MMGVVQILTGGPRLEHIIVMMVVAVVCGRYDDDGFFTSIRLSPAVGPRGASDPLSSARQPTCTGLSCWRPTGGRPQSALIPEAARRLHAELGLERPSVVRPAVLSIAEGTQSVSASDDMQQPSEDSSPSLSIISLSVITPWSSGTSTSASTPKC